MFMNKEVGAVSLGNPYLYFGQNMGGWADLTKPFDAASSVEERTAEFYKMSDNLKKINRIGLVFDAMPLAVAFRTNKKSRISYAVTWEIRAGLGLSFNREMGQLLMRGNKPQLGTNIDLKKGFRVSAQAMQAYGFGATYQLLNKPGDYLYLAVGGRAKVLVGLVSAQLKLDRLSLLNNEREMLLDYGYEIRTSSLHGNYDPPSLWRPAGWGFGADLGATLGIGKNWELSATLMNLGYLRFNKKLATYSGGDYFPWRGLETGDFLDTDGYDFEALGDRFQPAEDFSSSYTQNIGASMLLHAIYRIPKPAPPPVKRSQLGRGGNYRETDITPYFRTYDIHRFGLSYVQGFANGPYTTTSPFVVASYFNHPVRKFGWGFSGNWGGYSGFSVGLMTAVELRNFRLGLGTQQALALFAFPKSKAVDLNLSLDFAF